MTSDPFVTYRPKTDNEDIFASYRPKQQQQEELSESLGANVGRQALRSGSRIAEIGLGAPREFGEFLESLVPEKALIKGAEKIGLGKGAKTLLETTKKIAPYKLFPESEDIKKFSKFLFGKKVEPKNQWEEKADEVISDFAALALPLPGSKLRLLKPGLLALGGNAASDLVGRLGGEDKERTYAKLGTILVGSLINPKSADKLRNDLYKQASEARPADATVSAKKLSSNASHIENALMKGDPSAGSKKKSLSLLKDIKSKVKNNEINVEELEQFKRDINEARSGLYEEFKSNKAGRKTAKRNLDSVSKIIDKGLNEYGKKNPEWEAFYRPANEVHGAIAQSHKARNWIAKHIKKIGFPAVLAEAGIYHAGGIPAAAVATTAGAATLFGAEFAARFAKSPTLRKHYLNLITSALKEDIISTRQNLKKIQEELED
jgi:hypothetical protein